jgi:hypothetical protein
MAIVEACREATSLRGPMIFISHYQNLWLSKCYIPYKGFHIHERTKHIDVRYRYTREVIAKGNVKICKISTHDNLVDMMTKSVLALSRYL